MFENRLAVLLTICAAACGGGVDSKDLAAELIDAQCENAVECGFQPDRATCDSTTSIAGNDYETMLAGIESGLITYDADAAAACLDEYRAADCMFDGLHRDSACTDIFTGTVPVGGACFIDAECKDHGGCIRADSGCNREMACCSGTCGPARPALVALGGVCGDGTECVAMAYCKAPADSDGVCAALIAGEGSSCDNLDSCADPLVCDIFADVPKCTRPAVTGAACDPSSLFQCSDARDYCDPTSRTCSGRSQSVGCAPRLPFTA